MSDGAIGIRVQLGWSSPHRKVCEIGF